jgi:acyl-CoA synthetase (AMP-forming)/AMP-acid ligase II
MPGEEATLLTPLRAHAASRPDGTAFVFEGRTTGFAAFGRNTDIFFELLYGAMKAGIVAVPVNWRLAPPEVAAIVADARATLVVLGREYAGEADYAALPGMRTVLAEDAGTAWPAFAAWRDAQPDGAVPHVPAAADIALQLYTSGTTGQPKGVMLSHRALAAGHHGSARHELGWNRWSPRDTALLAMPVAHIAGAGWGLIAMHYGAACHIHRQFDPEATLRSIAAHRITRLFLVPAALQALVRHPGAAATDFSCLSEIGYGASPMPAPLLAECMGVTGAGFVQFYGMTETSGTIVALPPEDHTPDNLRAAGRALPWVELRVVGPDGTDMPPGMVGEIVTRSDANMTGYWDRPDETRRTIGADGWLRTGDAGTLDAEGMLSILDRIKEMVITGGENVYPAEVESALAAHPGVAEVAVIGIPHATWGEAVHAVVVLRPDAALTAEALIAWSRTRIAGFKCPRSVAFADALPRNAAGKLLKRTLREPHWRFQPRQVN